MIIVSFITVLIVFLYFLFKGNLPALKSSDVGIDRSKPLPTSLQSDFLPEDVLFALTQPPAMKDQLGPPSRFRNLNTSSVSVELLYPDKHKK